MVGQQLEIGQKWQYTQWWFDIPFGDSITTLEITGDTTLDGDDYYVIEGHCMCADTIRYIDEDKDRYYAYYDGSRHLLYDFNLVKGDTLKIKAPFSTSQDSIYIRIDSVGKILVSGEELTVQYINCYLADPGNTHWADWGKILIKGIGSDWCLTPQYSLCEIQTQGLSCVQYEDGSILQFDESKVCLYVNTDNPRPKSSSVYPNPSKGRIAVRSQEFNYASVFNSNGVLVQRIEGEGRESFELNLEKGIYILIIESNGVSEIIKMLVH